MVLLYVDDDTDDQDILREIVTTINPSIEVIGMRDCENAIGYLSSAEILPNIIIVDINMPGGDGFDCLKYVKEDDRLNKIPVIIYSTSISPRDTEMCRKFKALACLQKACTFQEGLDRLGKFLL